MRRPVSTFAGGFVPVETFSNLLHVPFCRLIIHLNTPPRPAALAPPGLRNFFPLKWSEIGPEYFGAEREYPTRIIKPIADSIDMRAISMDFMRDKDRVVGKNVPGCTC